MAELTDILRKIRIAADFGSPITLDAQEVVRLQAHLAILGPVTRVLEGAIYAHDIALATDQDISETASIALSRDRVVSTIAVLKGTTKESLPNMVHNG